VVVSNIVYTLDRQKGGNLLFMRVAPIELRPALAHYVKQWGTSDRPPEGPPAILRNIRFSNITAECDGAIFMDGDQEQDIEDVSFDNIRILMRGGVNKSGSADPSHPFHVFGHTQAPYGIFCRYVKDINFSNVRFLWNTPEQSEWGSPLRIHHGKNIGIDGFSGRQALGSTRPAIWLRDVEGAFVRNCRAPEGTGTFLRVSEETTNVTVMSNDLDQAAQALDIQQSVEASEVFLSGNRLPD